MMAMNPRLRISGAFSEIASATFFLTVPLLVLSSILLGLVYTKRVTHGKSAAAFQSSTVAEEPGVFYVNYSATKLALVASWSSSIAPLLPVFLMTLLSLPELDVFRRVRTCQIYRRPISSVCFWVSIQAACPLYGDG